MSFYDAYDINNCSPFEQKIRKDAFINLNIQEADSEKFLACLVLNPNLMDIYPIKPEVFGVTTYFYCFSFHLSARNSNEKVKATNDFNDIKKEKTIQKNANFGSDDKIVKRIGRIFHLATIPTATKSR